MFNNLWKIKMNFLIILLLAFALTISNIIAQTTSGQEYKPFGGGEGTEQNPYEIYTKQHLEELADSVNNGYYWSQDKFFHLMNNIDDSVRTIIGLGPTSIDFELICLLKRNTQKSSWETLKNHFHKGKIDSNLSKSFQGYFNGMGHKITLAINMPTANNIGLFGCVSGNGLILDLDVEGYVIGNSCVGGIIGYLRKSFTTQSFYMVSECRNYATITSTDGEFSSAGGIIGVAVGGKKNSIFIDRCINNGSVNVNRTKFHQTNDVGDLKSLVGSINKELIVKFRSIYE